MHLGVTAVMLPELDFEAQVELCVSLGIRCYQFRPRRIPADQVGKPYSCWGNHRFDLTPERLVAEGARLSEALARAGMQPWGTLPAVSAADSDDELLLHVEGAAASGAGRMRLAPPPYPRVPFDYPAYLEGVVERYQQVVARLARPRGIRLLIETHTGGAAASPALAWNIVRRFDPADLGVIFDLGNFACEGEVQPALAVSVLRDWIDCVHVGGSRRVSTGVDAAGARLLARESCAPADSDVHVPTWIAAIRDAGLQPPLIIEDFAADAGGPDRLRRDARFLWQAMAS